MFGLDATYLIVIGIGMLLAVGAQLWVKASVSRWRDVGIRRGWSGAEVARAILAHTGLSGARVERTRGFLTDHYDPSSRTLRLSEDVHDGRSVAAVGIAAHEAGHAIQHARGYWPLTIRQKMVPVANVGTNLGIVLVMAGLMLGFLGLAKVGVVVFAGFVVFTLITLPVEFDASRRAKKLLVDLGVIEGKEVVGVSRVLTAAAATYVAAALTALLHFFYFASLAFGRRS